MGESGSRYGSGLCAGALAITGGKAATAATYPTSTVIQAIALHCASVLHVFMDLHTVCSKRCGDHPSEAFLRPRKSIERQVANYRALRVE